MPNVICSKNAVNLPADRISVIHPSRDDIEISRFADNIYKRCIAVPQTKRHPRLPFRTLFDTYFRLYFLLPAPVYYKLLLFCCKKSQHSFFEISGSIIQCVTAIIIQKALEIRMLFHLPGNLSKSISTQ